jgi:hypothetical protein
MAIINTYFIYTILVGEASRKAGRALVLDRVFVHQNVTILRLYIDDLRIARENKCQWDCQSAAQWHVLSEYIAVPACQAGYSMYTLASPGRVENSSIGSVSSVGSAYQPDVGFYTSVC